MEVKDVEGLYDELMNLIIRFADSGVIHGDFNEFNIMITDEEKPIIIDFPQMVSTAHANAEVLFDRDVTCIKVFFKKRFNYESELYPKFSDIQRSDNLDAEIACSGFTKDMARDINIELGLESESDQSEASEDEIVDEITTKTESIQIENESVSEFCTVDSIFDKLKEGKLEPNTANSDHSENESQLSDSCSVDDNFESRSIRSTATTIHPEEIKKRVRKQLHIKEKKQRSKRCVIKGEASAVTRSRRENNDTIKDCSGIWGWD